MSQGPVRRIELIGEKSKDVIEGARGMVKLQSNEDIIFSPPTSVPGEDNRTPEDTHGQEQMNYQQATPDEKDNKPAE